MSLQCTSNAVIFKPSAPGPSSCSGRRQIKCNTMQGQTEKATAKKRCLPSPSFLSYYMKLETPREPNRHSPPASPEPLRHPRSSTHLSPQPPRPSVAGAAALEATRLGRHRTPALDGGGGVGWETPGQGKSRRVCHRSPQASPTVITWRASRLRGTKEICILFCRSSPANASA